MPTQSDVSSQSVNSNNKLIIFGEDDHDDIEFLRETFSSITDDYSLRFIDKGHQLIETLDAMPNHELPCLLVLDYNMPELNGAEILNILRNDPRYSHIPKIIWSTSGSDTYKSICMELGAADYVIKPGSVKDLIDTAKYLLSFCSAK